MEYRELGTSGLKVSVLSFGAWQIGDPNFWGAHDQDSAERSVQTAIDFGINFFDTAEMYGGGESERALGRALGRRRGEVFVASKVSPEHASAERLRSSCEASLQRLRTDYLDLYQIHWPPRETPFSEVYGELMRLRQEGKIRAIGVSNFGPLDLSEWQRCEAPASNQIGYNLVFRAPEFEIVPICLAQKTAILAYMPLMQGLLAGRWGGVDEIPMLRRRSRHFAGTREGVRHGGAGCEALLFATLRQLSERALDLGISMAAMSLAWLKSQQGVVSVIVGARDSEHVRRNVEGINVHVDLAECDRLRAITDPLKAALGRNADMWESEANSRIR